MSFSRSIQNELNWSWQFNSFLMLVWWSAAANISSAGRRWQKAVVMLSVTNASIYGHNLKRAVGRNLIYTTNIQISTEKFRHCQLLHLSLSVTKFLVWSKRRCRGCSTKESQYNAVDNGGGFLTGDKTLDSPPQQESIWRLSEAGAGRDSLPPLQRTLMETTRDLHRITDTSVFSGVSL